MNFRTIAAASGAALALSVTAANAEVAVGLVGDNTLVMIDSTETSKTTSVTVEGVSRLLGIDFRPSNKMLYGVSEDGTVVTIDPASGKATKGSQLDKMIPAGTGAIVDFNPAADKLRFMATDGTNLRADVDTGKVVTDGSLAFEAGDMRAGEKPNVVAAAYTNSYGKPEKTAMYDIDATIVALIQQTKPNDGTLKAVGKLGINPAETYALDIYTTSDGTNSAWLIADNTLYTVALDSGKASKVRSLSGIDGAVRDIAVMPQS